MPDSLFSSLLSTLDKRNIGDIATSMGESEQSVSTGMQASVATVLDNLTSRADDPGAIRQIVDHASNTLGEVTPSRMATAVTDPNSPLLSGGKRLVSSLFGNSESSVVNAVAQHSGLRFSSASSMLAMAAPMVMSFLAKRVRDEGLTYGALGNILHRESSNIRSALPAGLGDSFRSTVRPTSPVVAQTVTKPASAWPMILGLLALALLAFWIFNMARRPRIETASRQAADRVASLGDMVQRHLPDNVNINVPEHGVESNLLAYIQDPTRSVDTTTWFDFDRLTFDTGSTTLRPESQEQLANIAAIMKAYPNVIIKIGGFTDNVGDATQNMALSQGRAAAVMAEEVRMGVDPSRISAQGYGEQYPVADNSTFDGRARNRRVAIQVVQK